MPFCITSAKTGDQCEDLLKQMATTAMFRIHPNLREDIHNYNQKIMSLLGKVAAETSELKINSMNMLINLAQEAASKDNLIDTPSLTATILNRDPGYANAFDPVSSGWKRNFGGKSKFGKLLAEIEAIPKPELLKQSQKPGYR